MSTQTMPRPAARRARRVDAAATSLRAGVRSRLTVPLYRNGYALVASSLLTSALGLAYWVVAAHAYPPAAVGVNAALISAMTLLTSIAQLNLKGALNRFLPRAGPAAGRFVIRSYLLALGVTAVASVIFIAGLNIWSPRLAFLADRPELALWFVAGTMAWTVFVLQDSVLAGIRQAAWVPAENLVFSIAKLALLVAVAAAFPTLGVFVSWSLPAILLVVPVTLLLFRRLIPAHVRQTRGREQPAGTWGVARYAAADYAAYLVWAGTGAVMPLIVLQQLGPEANAYFFVSWSIAYSLYLISSGMGMAMLAEASLEPAQLRTHWRRTIVESARLVVPGALAVAAGAPLILGLMGGSYSAEAVNLLRLLALSAIPFIIVAAHVNAARVENRMRVVVGTFAALCGLVFALGLPLMDGLGIVGLGVAWLAAQSAVAATIAIGRLDRARWRSWPERLVPTLSAAGRRAHHWRSRLASRRALSAILESLASERSDASAWRVHGHAIGLNDVAISEVGPPDRPVALVKRARSRPANRSLENQERALLELDRDPRLGEWGRLVPRVLASGTVAGRRFLVETRMEGIAAKRLLEQGADRDRIIAAAERSIRPLHEATGATTLVDEELLRDWVDRPLAELRPVVARRSRVAGAERALEHLGQKIRRALAGRRVSTSRVHGDLCPDNILMSPDAATVTGFVDWEGGRARGLPALDRLHLAITTRMSLRRQGLGQVVGEMLADEEQRGSEHLVLLAWLHHVAGNVAKSRRYARSRVWVRWNIDPILIAALDAAASDTSGATAERAPWRRRSFTLPRGIAARLRAAPMAIRSVSLEWAAPIVGLSLAVVLWLASLPRIDPHAMTDLGLISVLPPAFYAALLVLTVSFVALAHRWPKRTPLLTAHVLALIAFLHATPAIVYGTLRYSWAWKHVGIVDYITRDGGVAPAIDYLSVYHNWPAFFGLDSLLTQLGGLDNTIDVAAWGPVFFNVLNLGALVFVFSALTRDRRVIWLGSWLFFITNWVGQDYFSPQAFAFFLYLVVLGTVLRWLGPRPSASQPQSALPASTSTAITLPSRLRAHWRERIRSERGKRGIAVAFVVLTVATIASTHALTSGMVTLALGALVLSRICAVRSLPIISAGIVALWGILFAFDFITHEGLSTLETVRLPWLQAESTLAPVGQRSDGQQLVALVARGLVVAIAALAIIGAVRQIRAHRIDRAAVILALAPLLLFASGSYEGEILFRIYLFAVPFLAYLAAHAFLPHRGRPSRSWWPAIASTAGCAAVLAGFLFAYYGKEHEYYFTPAEVAASKYLYAHAPSNALLIDGTTNYPHQFENYERFDYVTLSREPPASQARFASSPATVLSEWMSDEEHSDAFLIITRSQKAEVSDEGVMPPGSLDRIEDALLDSPQFRVVLQNSDAIIFALARDPRGASA
jgi:O-antigen/teichoic acid export membrane protein/aminoglycoside phosphotransferase